MKIRIRDAETGEVLHVISINADDDRRDDIVKQVIDGFDGRAVIVDDSDSEDDAPEDEKVPADSATSVDSAGRVEQDRTLADEAAAEPTGSLTGDAHPVDAPPGIPAEGTTA